MDWCSAILGSCCKLHTADSCWTGGRISNSAYVQCKTDFSCFAKQLHGARSFKTKERADYIYSIRAMGYQENKIEVAREPAAGSKKICLKSQQPSLNTTLQTISPFFGDCFGDRPADALALVTASQCTRPCDSLGARARARVRVVHLDKTLEWE